MKDEKGRIPDGPHQELLEYYKNKYNVNNNFIVIHTILVNKDNMEILLNDENILWSWILFGNGSS